MPTRVQQWQMATRPELDELAFLVREATDSDVMYALQVIDQICDSAAGLRQRAVIEARAEGASWSEIGEALGMSRQAAWERFRSGIEETACPA